MKAPDKILLQNKTSQDGGRIFWVFKDSIPFEWFEEEMNSIEGLDQLEINDKEDGLDVSFSYFEKRVNIEVVHPFGVHLHPNARSIFEAEDRDCSDELLIMLLCEFERLSICSGITEAAQDK